MFKNRPRDRKPVSKLTPAYWRERLFRNTYTYKGRRVRVRAWSVKIQLFGKRKAFSLNEPNRARAAAEACEVYRLILERGWEAAVRRRPGAGVSQKGSGASLPPDPGTSDLDYWRKRLVRRKYPEETDPKAGREFCVRIEHAGTGYYFPLQTGDEKQATKKAREIYQTVIRKGWAEVNATFCRELSLALRWQDNPLAWTYTTIHTCKDKRPPGLETKPPGERAGVAVAVIEPDDGIRLAIASCLSGHEGFRCEAAYESVAEALEEIPRCRVDLVLANQDLLSAPGPDGWEKLQRVRPHLAGIVYSVFEDADELFKGTPGGAILYLLKRTASTRMLEPIATLALPVTREKVISQVRDYFRHFAAALPANPPVGEIAKLTPREREILALLSKGDLAKEIADALGISFWTVQGHIKSIFEKLKVHSRIEAVVKFLQK